jgi:site-specific DNA recombinase
MRAAGYIRVSTEEQARHGWNLEADRERIGQIAQENGWELVEVFDDGGRQGDDPDRPGFNLMLDTLDQVDVVVMRSLDRLSRDTFLYALATRAFRTAGVQVYTFSGLVDLETPEGELAANVLAAIHRFEKRQIGARVAQAARARVKTGRHHGRPPHGYRTGPEGLVIYEPEAAVVQRIFREYVAGLSQWEIVAGLVRDGIQAQRKAWHQGTVSNVLKSRVYLGEVRFNGQWLEGSHEPIVKAELWAKAAALRAANVRSESWKGREPVAGHLLATGCSGAVDAGRQ